MKIQPNVPEYVTVARRILRVQQHQHEFEDF